jgi:hypothetical protein
MENIAGYVLDHTTRDANLWHHLNADERGPYFVSPMNRPRRDLFLKLVRLQRQHAPGCDPLDGREHGLDRAARWIGNRALAIRFVGLGVILGVFELATSWEAVPGEDLEHVDRRLAGRGEVRFRLTGSRPRTATRASANEAAPQPARWQPVVRRARYTRRKPTRAYGMTASARDGRPN